MICVTSTLFLESVFFRSNFCISGFYCKEHSSGKIPLCRKFWCCLRLIMINSCFINITIFCVWNCEIDPAYRVQRTLHGFLQIYVNNELKTFIPKVNITSKMANIPSQYCANNQPKLSFLNNIVWIISWDYHF